MTRFTVNDRPVQYRMDPETPLLWALRDASNLTGTKYGCGTGAGSSPRSRRYRPIAAIRCNRPSLPTMCRNAAIASLV